MIENEGATTEVEEVAPAEVTQSMDDTIRETLRGLQNKGESLKDESGDSGKSSEDEAQLKPKVRDVNGKFAAKEKTLDVATDPVDAAVDPEIAVEADPVKPAPNTWKKEAAATWDKLPAEVRAEVERREADFHRGIEQYKQAATFAQSIERAITPYAQTLQSLNIAPEKAISELMAADHKLRYGSPQEKSAYFAQLANNYGIDLANVQQQEQQYIDPNVSAMQQRVQQLEGWIQNQSLMGQRQQEEALNSEISKFAADPNHSHFESVKGHMAALLQAGQATDLASAYEQAVFANPQTRALVLAQQQAKERAEATKKAQAAKAAASVNVRSRPSLPTSEPIGTMDETIRSTLRKLQGA